MDETQPLQQLKPKTDTPNTPTVNFQSEIASYIQANITRWQSELAHLCATPEAAPVVTQMLAARQLVIQNWQTNETSAASIFGKWEVQPLAPTLLCYNYYDVPPIEPRQQWHTDPFVLNERDGSWWARGVATDKGNLVARLAALDTYRAIYGELPLNLKFIIEGEHNEGSAQLAQLLPSKTTELRADALLWNDGLHAIDGTAIFNLGLKGILTVELVSHTLEQNVQAGLAGVFPGAAWRLIWALAAINDDKDGIQVNGFYDDIAVPTRDDSLFMAANQQRYTTRNADRLKHFAASEYQAGIKGLPLLITEFFTPTANVSGFQSGYVGSATLQIVPSHASARLDFRLVPDQHPDVVLEQLKDYLQRNRFEDIEIRSLGTGLQSARTSPSDPFVELTVKAALMYGAEPLLVPLAPDSGPLSLFKTALNDLPSIGVGVAYDGSNPQAPNENIRRDDFIKHIKFLVELFHSFADFKREAALNEIAPFALNLDLADTHTDATTLPETVETAQPRATTKRPRRRRAPKH